MKKFLTIFAVAALAVLAAVSCEKEILLEGLEMSQTSVTLEVGGTVNLAVALKPENVTNKPTVEWSSSNDAVATVNGGVVTAVAPGSAVITAKAGTISATCNVTVNEPETPPGPGDEYKGPVQGSSEWSVIGALLEKNWDTDFVCAEEKGGFVLKDVKLTTDDLFKFRHNKDWADNRGINEPNVDTVIETAVPTKAVPNGGNIKVAANGNYDLWYFADKEAIVVVAKGASLPDIPSFVETPPTPDNWDYTPGAEYNDASNLWKSKAAGHEKYYYYHCTGADWNGADTEATDVPFLTVNQSTYVLHYADFTASQWQNQFFVFPDEGHFIPLNAAKSYKFKVTIGANKATPGFLKVSRYKAEGPKHEGDVISEYGAFQIDPAQPTVIECELSNVECDNIIIVMDFGGNPDDVNVYIKDITLTEAGSADPNAYALIGCHAYDNSNPWGWTTNFDSEPVQGDWRVVKNIGSFDGKIDFKFRLGDDWSSQIAAVNAQNKELNVLFPLRGIENDMEPKNIILEGDGTYDIYLNPVEMKAFILTAGSAFAVPTQEEVAVEVPFSIIGYHAADNNPWGWSTNVPMTAVAGFDGWTMATIGAYEGKIEFKFRQLEDWATQIGGLNDITPRQTGVQIPLKEKLGGPDPYNLAFYGDGDYDVYLNVKDLVAVVYPAGTPFTIPTEVEKGAQAYIGLDGLFADWSDIEGVEAGSFKEFKYAADEENLYFYFKIKRSKIIAGKTDSPEGSGQFPFNWRRYIAFGINTDGNDATGTAVTYAGMEIPGCEAGGNFYPFRGYASSASGTDGVQFVNGVEEQGGISTEITANVPDGAADKVTAFGYADDDFVYVEAGFSRAAIGSPASGKAKIQLSLAWDITDIMEINI